MTEAIHLQQSRPVAVDAKAAVDADEKWRLSRFSAEFVDPLSEAGFREQHHDGVVRDTQFAFGAAGVLCMLLVIGDYLALGLSDEFYALLKSRVVASLLCLAVIAVARPYWRLLMDGTIPTLIQVFGLVGFLSVTFLRPFEPGWHGMSMMLMLFGIYVLVPNRFLIVVLLALSATLAFLTFLDVFFNLTARELVVFSILLGMTNLIGARFSYQKSLAMRQAYLAEYQQQQIQAQLQLEVENRQRLQTERDALAQSDVLTGTVNRRYFHDALEREIEKNTGSEALCLLMLEIDFIKQIHITYGHQHSETVLNHLVSVCRHVLRQSDSLSRVGEAAFAILLPNTDLRIGRLLVERLHAEMHRLPVRLPAVAFYINASFGLAKWHSKETCEAFLQRADAALAQAKSNGGGRVMLAQEPPLPVHVVAANGDTPGSLLKSYRAKQNPVTHLIMPETS